MGTAMLRLNVFLDQRVRARAQQWIAQETKRQCRQTREA
jgi:hypothetical protein